MWRAALSLAEPAWLLGWGMLLARAGGVVSLAPVLGSRSVPVVVRLWLTVLLAAVLFVLQPVQARQIDSPLQLTLALGLEFLVGLCLGLAVRLVLLAAEMAGEVVSFVSALSLAEVVSPGTRDRMPVLSQLTGLVALGVFLALDGPAQVVLALGQSLRSFPPGAFHAWSPPPQLVADLLQTTFQFGLRIAAPTVTALLASNLLLGLLTRTLPQLNIFVLGLGINSMVVLGMLALSLGALAWYTPQLLEGHLERVFWYAPGPPVP